MELPHQDTKDTDPSSQVLSFGTLDDTSELGAWFDFVASVFSKSSRQYFVNHWKNDPTASRDAVFVARERTSGAIVATVRVFQRQMFVNGGTVSVGGIGEVSTRPDYRRQKLATRLLQMAIEFMKTRHVALATLHTGSQAPLYSSIGFFDVPMVISILQLSVHWVVVVDPSAALKLPDTGLICRAPDFGSDDLPQMMHAYESLCRSCRLNGPFVRNDPAYWRAWVQHESTTYGSRPVAAFDAATGNLLRAYMFASVSLGENNSNLRVKIKEFVPSADQLSNPESCYRLFLELLLRIIVQDILSSTDLTSYSPLCVEVCVAQPLVESVLRPSNATTTLGSVEIALVSTLEERHSGTMYSIVDPDQPFMDTDRKNGELHNRHLFWQTDGF